MTLRIPEKDFRFEVETLLKKSIDSDYVRYILDYRVDDSHRIFDLIRDDVEASSGWEDEGCYTDGDIKLAVGRVFSECFCNFY